MGLVGQGCNSNSLDKGVIYEECLALDGFAQTDSTKDINKSLSSSRMGCLKYAGGWRDKLQRAVTLPFECACLDSPAITVDGAQFLRSKTFVIA